MSSDHLTSRRQRILDAAEAEFAARGFSGARMARIAATAAVNKQLLFHYFESKAGLHQAVADVVAARSAIATPTGKTPAERLRPLIDELVRTATLQGALLSDDWRSRATQVVTTIIEDGQRSGHFRDDVDPAAISEIVVAASLGASTMGGVGQRAGASLSRFAGSLAQVISDHASWR